jgi:hypothetical protein
MAAEAIEATPEAPAAEAPASGKPDKKAKAKDPKKGGKDPKKKGEKGAEDEQSSGGAPSVAAHPRAARAVATAKGWGGLAGFVLGGYLSLPTNTLAGAGLRALVAGIVCYVATWGGAVFLWRRLVMLELKGREQQLLAPTKARTARRELPPPVPERPPAGIPS